MQCTWRVRPTNELTTGSVMQMNLQSMIIAVNSKPHQGGCVSVTGYRLCTQALETLPAGEISLGWYRQMILFELPAVGCRYCEWRHFQQQRPHQLTDRDEQVIALHCSSGLSPLQHCMAISPTFIHISNTSLYFSLRMQTNINMDVNEVYRAQLDNCMASVSVRISCDSV